MRHDDDDKRKADYEHKGRERIMEVRARLLANLALYLLLLHITLHYIPIMN